jgi:flagellar hook protein FlgE
MYSAVSGLQAHQTKMNVIGNNIANVNTYGFKSSRVTFSDVFYQTMNGASSPTTNGGGTNPTQLGYGAKVNSIDVINTRAGSATTDRALDVYINGDGYLPVKDSEGVIKYTRVGVLNFDSAGNLVDRNGNMVLGFQLDATTKNPRLGADGTTSAQNLAPIHVDPDELDKYTGISIGQNGEITAIKEGDPVITLGADTAWITDTGLPVESTLNGSVTITTATPSANSVLLPGSYSDGDPFPVTPAIPATADIQGAVTLSRNGTGYTLTFTQTGHTSTTSVGPVTYNPGTPGDPDTLSFNVPADGGGTVALTIAVHPDTGTGGVDIPDGESVTLGTAVPENIALTLSTYDKSGQEVVLAGTWSATTNNDTLTFGTGNQAISLTVNPSALGSLSTTALEGSVIGSIGPGAGVPVKIAHMATVKFINQDGLSQDGEGYCIETTNSGEAIATIPGNGGTGNFRAGALEMSNVDLSREFTEMIITQRGFQANTRMITTSDEMLSELVSMKR